MRLRSLLALVAVVLAPVMAKADSLAHFTLSGEGNTFTFSLPPSPTPSGVNGSCPSGFDGEFCLDNVVVSIVNGTVTDTMEFFDASNGGGLTFETLSLFGDQVFTGDVTSPMFATGTYYLYTGMTAFPDYTLQVVVPTPEPSSLLLLSSGVLGGVTVLRRRRSLGIH